MIVHCSNCGKEINRSPSKVKNVKNVYCSQGCWAEFSVGKNNPSYKGGKLKVACAECGAIVERYPSQRNEKTFCNTNCNAEWMKKNDLGKRHYNWKQVDMTCDWCGIEFSKPPSLVVEGNNYCSNKCRGMGVSKRAGFAYKKDNNHDEIVLALKNAGVLICEAHLIGNGFPDLIAKYKNKIYLLEIKNPNTHHGLTQAQQRFFDAWRGQVAVVESADDALRVIGATK